jgi:hypothetical protein
MTRLRLSVLAFALAVVAAAPAAAQVTNPDTQRVGVTYTDDGRGPLSSFTIAFDGETPRSVVPPTPDGTTYAFAFPANITNGSHTVSIAACRTASTPLCGPALLLTFTVQRPIPPPTLDNIRIITTEIVRLGVPVSKTVIVEPIEPPQE